MPSNKEELSALLLSLHGDLARVQSRLDYLTSEVGEYHRKFDSYSFDELVHTIMQAQELMSEVREIQESRGNVENELHQTRKMLDAMRITVENVAEQIGSGETERSDYLAVAPVKGFPDPESKRELRYWWHEILRNYGRYSCFAILFMLPSDKEAIRYVTEFSRELHLISGMNCLVVGMGKTDVQHFNFDEKQWKVTIDEQISDGYSLNAAQLFEITFSEFPCFVIFRDIRSPEHIVVSLKGLLSEDISEKMRLVFSLINEANVKKVNPLEYLEHQRGSEKFRRAGVSIVSELRSFAGKTFEAVMEATIKAVINSGTG
jgi:hypothetical protein